MTNSNENPKVPEQAEMNAPETIIRRDFLLVMGVQKRTKEERGWRFSYLGPDGITDALRDEAEQLVAPWLEGRNIPDRDELEIYALGKKLYAYQSTRLFGGSAEPNAKLIGYIGDLSEEVAAFTTKKFRELLFDRLKVGAYGEDGGTFCVETQGFRSEVAAWREALSAALNAKPDTENQED